MPRSVQSMPDQRTEVREQRSELEMDVASPPPLVVPAKLQGCPGISKASQLSSPRKRGPPGAFAKPASAQFTSPETRGRQGFSEFEYVDARRSPFQRWPILKSFRP